MKRLPLIAALLIALPAAANAQLDTPPPVIAPVLPAKPQIKRSAKEQELLDKIRGITSSIRRQYGSCRYDWAVWKLAANGIRTSTFSCSAPVITDQPIAISCSALKVATYAAVLAPGELPTAAGWSAWRLPAANGEDEAVAALCANAMPAPAPVVTPVANPS